MSTVSGLEIANNIEREWRDRLKKAVLAERENVARWFIERGYATGHGDTVEDLLVELEWQVAEREREACAKAVEQVGKHGIVTQCANAIRARGNT